jgi:hypothetical protein
MVPEWLARKNIFNRQVLAVAWIAATVGLLRHGIPLKRKLP